VNEEIKRAIEFAMEKELEAEAFYKEWAAKVKSPAVVALFAEMAATEHGHYEMLAHLTPEDLPGGEGAPAPQDLKISEMLVGAEATENMNVQEAMILAMKREEGAAALYDELARAGGETQSLFESLANDERKHKNQIETQYDDEILTEN